MKGTVKSLLCVHSVKVRYIVHIGCEFENCYPCAILIRTGLKFVYISFIYILKIRHSKLDLYYMILKGISQTSIPNSKYIIHIYFRKGNKITRRHKITSLISYFLLPSFLLSFLLSFLPSFPLLYCRIRERRKYHLYGFTVRLQGNHLK